MTSRRFLFSLLMGISVFIGRVPLAASYDVGYSSGRVYSDPGKNGFGGVLQTKTGVFTFFASGKTAENLAARTGIQRPPFEARSFYVLGRDGKPDAKIDEFPPRRSGSPAMPARDTAWRAPRDVFQGGSYSEIRNAFKDANLGDPRNYNFFQTTCGGRTANEIYIVPRHPSPGYDPESSIFETSEEKCHCSRIQKYKLKYNPIFQTDVNAGDPYVIPDHLAYSQGSPENNYSEGKVAATPLAEFFTSQLPTFDLPPSATNRTSPGSSGSYVYVNGKLAGAVDCYKPQVVHRDRSVDPAGTRVLSFSAKRSGCVNTIVSLWKLLHEKPQPRVPGSKIRYCRPVDRKGGGG